MEKIGIELTAADPAAILHRLQNAGIPLLDVEMVGEYQIRFQIWRADEKQFAAIADRYGEPWRVTDKQGISWALARLLRHPVLVLGMAVLLFLSFWVPSRIFFVQVQGNQNIPAAQIIQAAARCGISFGASCRQARSQQVKNTLLEAIPDLQWAGIDIRGCVAVITVRERTEPEEEFHIGGIGNIIALRDGMVDEITVLQGTALCRPGQAVKAGQVLISGYTDCGICILAEQAEGEVFAHTSRRITVVTPANHSQKQETTATVKKYSLIIGKKRINFSNSSGNLAPTCAKIYSEKYLTLPGGFLLPLALVTETYVTYTSEEVSAPDMSALLQQFSQQYLLSQMLSGEVLDRREVSMQPGEVYRLDGVYGCREMIGLFRPEENLPNYEND